MRKYEIIDVSNVEVTVDVSKLIKTDEMWFNATTVLNQFKGVSGSPLKDYTRVSDWLKQDRTQEYLSAVSSNCGISCKKLVVTKTGRYGGTYLHNRLALEFARWLSADFAVALDTWVVQKLKETQCWKQARLEAKTGFLPMTEAVSKAHDPVKFYHYSTEANLINIVLTGMSAKKFKEYYQVEHVRDALTQAQLELLEKLQRLNTSLIEIDMSYDERKDKLQYLYDKELLLLE